MTRDTDLIRRGDAPVVPAEGLAAELSSTMSRYDAAALPDDENGMAAPVMLGPEYVRNIIAALRAGCGPSWEVLPLTWESFGLEMWADSVGGRYYISGHGGKWSWSFDDDDPYHHGETVASEEAARSAANAHNSAHIATALRSAPPVGAWVTWIATADRLPEKPGKRSYEQIECLIKLPNGGIEVSMWNCEHMCWDDADGDDFRFDPGQPTHWMPIPDLPAALLPAGEGEE